MYLGILGVVYLHAFSAVLLLYVIALSLNAAALVLLMVLVVGVVGSLLHSRRQTGIDSRL